MSFVYFLKVVNGCVCVRPSFDVESSMKKKQRKERKHPSNLTTVDCHEEAEEAEKEKSRAEARKKNATSCFCDSHDNTNKENNKEVLN